MPLKKSVKEIKKYGGLIVGKDELQQENNDLRDKIVALEAQVKKVKDLKFKDCMNMVDEALEQEKANRKEISTQTDETYFYDTGLEGWAGF